MNQPRIDPEHIAISKTKGVQIDWKDGHHSEYGLRYLRDQCPCATCANAHGDAPPPGPFQMYKAVLKIDGVEPVGQYALRIRWSDGHDTGMYSWEHFRNVCPCEECRGRG